MELLEITEKLNLLNAKRNPNGVKLIYDNVENGVVNFIKGTNLYAVLVIADDTAFSLCGKRVVDTLQSNNVPFYNLVLTKKRTYSLKDFEEVFSVNQKVNGVICLGGYCNEVAKYFCSINQLPLLYVISDYNLESLFVDDVYINLNDKIEKIKTNVAKFVVIDKELINSNDTSACADAFLLIQSKLCSLINYRANAIINNKKAQPYVCSVVEDGITHGFNIENKLELAESLIKIALAHALDSNFSLFSDEACGERLFNENLQKAGLFRYILFLRFAEVYKMLGIKNVGDNLSVPFYTQRANWMQDKTLIPIEQTTRYFSSNRCSASVLLRLKPLAKTLKTDFNAVLSAEESIFYKYVKAGGDIEDRLIIDTKLLKEALIHTADYPIFYGLLDVCRDLGILESAEKIV